MPLSTQRYTEYLGTYHFYPNSIEFRIVSSKAIEKFKNVQSFQLNQLVNGKFFFAQDKREILLLKYDMWSRWLIEVENLFIELHETSDKLRQKDIDIVIALADKTSAKYESIILDEHIGHFEPRFSKIWVESHAIAYGFLIDSIRKLHGTYEYAFGQIVDMLVEALQYTLVEIHELNEIFKHKDSKSIFLVGTELCRRFHNETGECLIAKRCATYKKYFDFDMVWLKNYTDHSLPDSLTSQIEACGVEIDYKRCVFN